METTGSKSVRRARWGAVAVASSVVVGACGLKGSRIAANETATVAALRIYLGAQNQFHRADRYGKGAMVYANPKDGKGFADLHRLPNGETLMLVDAAFAGAMSPDTARNGYYFVDIVEDAEGKPYDFSTDCGLCAVPAQYGVSGRKTLVIDITGTVYVTDNGGQPVTAFPDVKKGDWLAL